MENQASISKQASHPGGDTQFWRDDMVQEYERKQSLLWEKREELFANIARIVDYFRELRSITAPKILDIGCGPGIPTTSSAYILEQDTVRPHQALGYMTPLKFLEQRNECQERRLCHSSYERVQTIDFGRG